MYMSEADIEPSAVLAKWLAQQPTLDHSGSALTWLGQLLSRAHDALSTQPVVVPSTRFGLLENVLSQLTAGISGKRDVMLGVARGLGFTLQPEHRQQYIAQLARWVPWF